MRRFLFAVSVFILPLAFFACTANEVAPVVEEETLPPPAEEESMLDEEDLVTHNVMYTGILEEGGVTIYQQGTNHLMLSDGKIVLLKPAEAADISLDLYVGKLVRVKGDVMPTVEAGGTIMEVKDIVWIRREVNKEGGEQEALRVLCGGASGAGCPSGFVCELAEEGPGMCLEDDSGESEESEDAEGAEEIEESEESEESEEFEELDEEDSAVDQSETVTLMIDEDYADDRWTQEYCSSHVGFCVPVHKNWYFKSFGATTSLLWHIEMGASAVDSFGDGPLIVDLKSGDLVALGVENGDVKIVGSRVIGYRSWSDGRHFEISADASLKTPVMFVTQELKGSEK